MVSKYRAHIGISQGEMDSIAVQFPEINDITKFDNFSSIIQYLLGKMVKGELQKKVDSKKDEIADKIKEQTYLALCLKNWKSLKENETFDNAKAIITGKKSFDAPKLTELIDTPESTEPIFDGINDLGYCGSCKHLHNQDAPRKCTKCNCGVRG